ncbi:MAG TPA: DUF2905 domain-containing protein [Clostridia bacterium]|nr:DUF2905 domain-containing protein [Clostridia bacterium]
MGFGGRPIITIGAILIITGIILIGGAFLGIGKLPGDFVFKKGSITFYFPLLSSIIVSIVLTFVLNVFLGKR